MKHPNQAELALLAGGELDVWTRWRLRRHVGACSRCARELKEFQSARGSLREGAGEMPPEADWDRLSAEMTANIRLGLAAGECVASAPAEPVRLGWRAALSLASITLIIISGWWLHLPRPKRTPELAIRAMETEGFVLEATSDGIELKANGRAMTLMHPDRQPAVLSVSTQGAMRARYVDAESGQVTINHVYAE